ncbi:F-box domain-containing protein [Mycena chlorophos]|uniref:F-box domain-containing protein n=1 Tax=Mycena chlorophos TaxID=658473 RepID=A0A8H6WPB1_MYCCL|nr:F-box domain-containing protein [Mycena chlorophos]
MAAAIYSNLAALDAKIASLEAQLVTARAEKQQQERALQEITFPINTLPAEILSRIVLFAHDAYVQEVSTGALVDPLPMRAEKRHSLKLARVCRQWRDIVFGCPEIWSRVTMHCGRVKSAVEALKTWLPRAGALPLDFSVRLIEPTAHTTWELLLEHSAQWRHVEFHASDSLVFSLASAAKHMPFFETLWIKGDIALEDAEHISMPNFHNLKLDTPFVLYQLTIPLAQITSLDLTGESASGMLEMLSLVPELTSLSLYIVSDPEEPNASSTSHCILGQLQTLKFNPDLPSVILAGLHTPRLEHLSFDQLPYDFAPVAALAARASCTIRTLCVKKSSRKLVSRSGPLKSLPTLQSIDIAVDTWKKADFATLHQLVLEPKSTARRLADLESITLRGCPRDVDGYVLSDLVEKRWGWVDGQARVHTLTLEFGARKPQDPVDHVRHRLGQKRYATGLKLSLVDPWLEPEVSPTPDEGEPDPKYAYPNTYVSYSDSSDDEEP